MNKGIGIRVSAVSANLPLDNIISVANAAALPVLGDTVGRVFYYTQDTLSWYFWNGSAWVLILDDSDHAALLQVIQDLSDHLSDATDAHDASAISSVAAGNLAATNVQAALDELQSDIDTRATQAALDNHINDTTAAHAATAISVTPTGNLAADDVQEALQELQGDIDTINARPLAYVVVANSAVNNAATFDPANNRRQVQQISGNGGSVTLADLGVTNAASGDELVLIGTDDTNTVTLVSATNALLNGSCTLAANDAITFVYINSKWREISRSA